MYELHKAHMVYKRASDDVRRKEVALAKAQMKQRQAWDRLQNAHNDEQMRVLRESLSFTLQPLEVAR